MANLTTKAYPNAFQSFGMAGIVILGFILIFPLEKWLNISRESEAAMLLFYMVGMGIPFLLLYAIRKYETGEKSFPLRIGNYKVIPFIVIATTALLFGVLYPIGSLIPMTDELESWFRELAGRRSIFSFTAIVVAAPVLEELIFRGMMLDGLLKKYTPTRSILISSLLFGVVHLNPAQFVSAFVLGIFIGWIYYQSKSLGLAILIHATNNFIGFTSAYFGQSDGFSSDITIFEVYGGVFNFVLATGGFLLIIVLCLSHLRKMFSGEKKCVKT